MGVQILHFPLVRNRIGNVTFHEERAHGNKHGGPARVRFCPREYDQEVVRCWSIADGEDWASSIDTLQADKCGRLHTLERFRYKSWPDHGLKEYESATFYSAFSRPS